MEKITVIKPKSSLWEIDFKEIWQYRDLYRMYVKRDIITQYKQTILGPLWFFVQPALTTIMYMFIFGGVAKISTDGLPQPLFYLSGQVLWLYFADCLNKTSSTFTTNQNIFGKVYFPRLIVPLSTVTSNLIKMAMQLILFVIIYVVYLLFVDLEGLVLMPNETLVVFPLLVFILAGLSLGFGIIISSMTTKYRDLTILFTFVVQLWMYATPIIYPMSAITDEKYRLLISLNPVTSIVEAFRYATMGVGQFSWSGLAYSFGFMVVVLGIGILIFNKVQRSFMDTV